MSSPCRKRKRAQDVNKLKGRVHLRALVTGARGFVGARVMAALDGAVPAPSLRGLTADDIRRIVDETAPDVILHTAAISDIPTCEKNPEASYHANVEIPVWLARTGVKLVAFSTDQVYSGCDDVGPYTEEIIKPANLYAKHKLEMERRTLELNPDTVLLRATWMYDMPMYGVANRGNFLVNMLREPALVFSSTQQRAVTYVRIVAEQLSKAALLPGGAYNFGSENDLTILQTAQWLKAELDLPITLTDGGERHNLWMDCTKAKSLGVDFGSTIDGLRRCIRDYALR